MADTLVARLEKAKSGSRELSDECLLAIGWEIIYSPNLGLRKGSTVWFPFSHALPSPTENAQDAIDWLVPEGWSYSHGAPDWSCTEEGESPSAPAWANVFKGRSGGWNTTTGATPALALCIAGLKALEAGI